LLPCLRDCAYVACASLGRNERNFLSLPRKEHGMGDKGGKKDKAKSQKQKNKKQKDKSRKQQEKQKPRTP